MSFIFETDRIGFRGWKKEDRKEFARMNGDPMVMEYMPRSLTEKESNHLVDKFEAHFDEHDFGLYALERKEDGAFMGFTGLQHVPFKAPFTPAVEIAWRLDYGFWGQGFGSEAAKAVLEHGRKVLEIPEIVAFTVFDNARSIAVMEKIGMSRDIDGDITYPNMSKEHPLRSLVLYRA